MNEEEKLIRMKNAENIAQEIFQSLKNRLVKEHLGYADSLHIGVVLSACIINVASKRGNTSKQELLGQFIEALEEHVEAYEVVQLN